VTVTQQNATQVATTANKNARYSYKKTNSFKKHWNILAITYKLKHQQQHPTPKKHIKKRQLENTSQARSDKLRIAKPRRHTWTGLESAWKQCLNYHTKGNKT
jgi:hypothetical protein